MSIVTEDGTGKSDSESYVSVADCSTYADNRGLAFSASTEPLQEQALRRSAVWLDSTYRSRFTGFRTDGHDQALEWPRQSGVYQSEPFGSIPTDIVPQEVINAQCEAAVRELATPGGLSPDVVAGKIQTSVTVVGAISVDYAASSGVADQKPVMTIISGILFNVITAVVAGMAHSSRGG